MDIKKIRNFAIIAHIDHGKSTLADRILEISQTISKRDLQNQHLDSMDLEKERGITIKLNAVQIHYQGYLFHLIDTPGHVDFTSEVSRSLSACEGAILLVDATQGIQAQTLANVYLALEYNLKIIVVINKIDLPAANVLQVKQEIANVLGLDVKNAVLISAKTGKNVDQVLRQIIAQIPNPLQNTPANINILDLPLQALVFDSYYDLYRGVILFIRIFQGKLTKKDLFYFMSDKNQKTFEVVDLGIRNPNEISKEFLSSGEVGWVSASLKNASEVLVGDTLTLKSNPAPKPIKQYKKLNPNVFVGFFPVENKDFLAFKDALEKITLSDSALTYIPESSTSLGHGFRIGFLGLLHMEVIQERLKREFNLNLIATAPAVELEIIKTDKTKILISNPASFLPKNQILEVREPFVETTIFVSEEFLGKVMDLCQKKRGIYQSLDIIDDIRRKLVYHLPLQEIIYDFFDKLKSYSKGFASFEYNLIGFFPSKLVKIDFLLNGQKVDALSFICHQDFSYEKAKLLVQKLKQVLPRQNFEIPIQAAIENKIIARETIKAYRKDVTAKLYGGDVTRRKKLLEKQKKGKKKMKQIGKVTVSQEAFLALIKADNN